MSTFDPPTTSRPWHSYGPDGPKRGYVLRRKAGIQTRHGYTSPSWYASGLVFVEIAGLDQHEGHPCRVAVFPSRMKAEQMRCTWLGEHWVVETVGDAKKIHAVYVQQREAARS